MYTEVEKINEKMSDMESITNPETRSNYVPIVLRHKDYMDTDGNHLFGFYGFRVRAQRTVGGQVKIDGGIDTNDVCTFYHDKKGVQWAVIPDCAHNRKVLIDNAKKLPCHIQVGPQDLKDAFMAARMAEEPIKQAQTKEPIDTRDPFNYTVPDTEDTREEEKKARKPRKKKIQETE